MLIFLLSLMLQNVLSLLGWAVRYGLIVSFVRFLHFKANFCTFHQLTDHPTSSWTACMRCTKVPQHRYGQKMRCKRNPIPDPKRIQLFIPICVKYIAEALQGLSTNRIGWYLIRIMWAQVQQTRKDINKRLQLTTIKLMCEGTSPWTMLTESDVSHYLTNELNLADVDVNGSKIYVLPVAENCYVQYCYNTVPYYIDINIL